MPLLIAEPRLLARVDGWRVADYALAAAAFKGLAYNARMPLVLPE
jgi:hypothetical protein